MRKLLMRIAGCVLLATVCVPLASASEPCTREKVATIGASAVFADPHRTALFHEGGLAIDADGAPNAYHPEDRGLDHLANAGRPGNWWGLATVDGKPAVQGPNDPNPGFYVSTTSLVDRSQPATSPARYVDSSKIPYLALPPGLMAGKLPGGAKLGDFAAVMNRGTGKVVYAIVADVGPRDHLGEGSIALAEALGVDSSPKKGGARSGLSFVIFPASGAGKPRSLEEIAQEGAHLLAQFGGAARLAACTSEAE